MKKLISERAAAYGLIFIFSLVTVFHFLALSGVIPMDILWGGRLQDRQQLIVFETISLAINIIMLLAVLIHQGMVKVKVPEIIVKGILWLMFVVFALNTIGNLFALNNLETLLFTPVTFVLAIFSIRLAVEAGKRNA